MNFIKYKILIFTISIGLLPGLSQLSAQQYDELVYLDGYKTSVYFSAGSIERAIVLAERMDRVMNFYNKLIQYEPEFVLLILNPEDWGKFTEFPVYGMPHYDNKKLIVASENNIFWDSFIPPVDKLPKELAENISNTYVDSTGNLSMEAFFDLLAIHEIGHAYHLQAGLNVQRKWMGELFCNILLHAYIAENEPDQLPALTVFPQMVIASGTEGFTYTSLEDIEQRYEEIGQQHPQNYGWYQCRWHSAAADIYDEGGVDTFIKLWDAFKIQQENLDDSELANFLSQHIHQSIGDVMLKWDE